MVTGNTEDHMGDLKEHLADGSLKRSVLVRSAANICRMLMSSPVMLCMKIRDNESKKERKIMSRELLLRNIEKAQREISQKKPMIETAKMRQHYHFMPEVGWMNDPNGLIFFKGYYHFFYQYNPYDSQWGAMHWGHGISKDLVHWEYLPIALAPSEPYDDYRNGGCFSGSAIEADGILYLFYTGAANVGDRNVQTQCLAYSEDGIHFEKYENNPVVTAPDGYDPANFRDPKVWKHEDYWYMVCGAAKNNLAQALLFRSSNMVDWEFFNVLAESRGELGYMWECPDFYSIEDKYVLMFSAMGLQDRTVIYLVGDMNYETGKFNYTTMGEIDWGLDYYAPQTFLDKNGRRLMVGWANGWGWMPWWKDWGPTYKEGWCGSFGLPREVKLCSDSRLQFVPVKELELLRYGKIEKQDLVIDGMQYEIPVADGARFEMLITVNLDDTDTDKFSLLLRCDKEKYTVVEFDLKHQMMCCDRNHADGWSKGASKSPLILMDKHCMVIHVFVDQSSVEIFTDDYKTCHSLNVFAAQEQNQNYIQGGTGKLYINSLVTWGMKNIER